MPDKQEPLLEKMKKMPLWQWGGITIFAGMISNLTMKLMIQAGDMSRREAQAAQMGGAIACGLFIIIGIVLIVMHFVRKRK